MKAFLKKYALGIVSGVVSLGIMLYFGVSSHGLPELVRILVGARGRWVLAACGCIVAFWIFEALVLHIFTLRLVPKYRFSCSLYNMMIGQLYNALTPFATGGQVVQVVAMERTGLRLGASTAVLAMRTMVYHVVLAVYAVVSVAVGIAYLTALSGIIWGLIVVGLLSNVVVASAMALIQRKPRIIAAVVGWGIRLLARIRIVRQPEKRIAALNRQIVLFHESTAAFARSRRATLCAYALGFLQMTFFFAIPYCIYRSFWYTGANPGLMVAIQSIVSLVSAFVPLPGAAGGAEGSFALMFSNFFANGDVVPAILLWRMVTYYACIVVGALVAVVAPRLLFRAQAAKALAQAERPALEASAGRETGE